MFFLSQNACGVDKPKGYMSFSLLQKGEINLSILLRTIFYKPVSMFVSNGTFHDQVTLRAFFFCVCMDSADPHVYELWPKPEKLFCAQLSSLELGFISC